MYHSQLLDLAALLGPSYGHVGVGRDDGMQAGEYSPIFYDRRRFEVVDWKTIWLSPTPEVPGSKGWDTVSRTERQAFQRSDTSVAESLSDSDIPLSPSRWIGRAGPRY